MRTTVQIPDRLRAGLLALAAKRGLRGYSRIVEEALEMYLADLAAKDRDLSAILKLKGAWDDDEVKTARLAIRDVRMNWDAKDRK